MTNLIPGLIPGIIFGALMQSSRVIRYDKQLGALRLIDMTIVKFMISAVVVGSIGIYLMKDLGYVQLSVKSFMPLANISGGLLFGIGWGLFGYCPGTSLGALGEGRWDSLWGIFGMIIGAAFFAEVYPVFKISLMKWGSLGKVTLPEMIGINHWFIIIPFAVLSVLLCNWLEKKGL